MPSRHQPQPQIVVVGSLNTDLVIRTPRLPRPGETLTGGEFFTAHGGKGANQAVAAARQGVPVAMVGCVGDDDFGAAHRSALAAEGMDLQGLRVVAGTKTGVAVILLDDDRQNSIVVSPGANAALTPALVAESAALIRSAAVLVCQMESPIAAVGAAMREARAASVKVVFNPAPAASAAKGLVPLADYLIVNESEAEMLSGVAAGDEAGAERAARALVGQGAGAALVTMGARGVVAVAGGVASRHPAFAVKPVDTTGAGDTFVGNLAVGLAAGLGLADVIRRAQAAAALAVTRLGAQPSIPTADVVDAFLAHQTSIKGNR